MKTIRRLPTAICLVPMLLVACGGSASDNGTYSSASNSSASSSVAPTTISITGPATEENLSTHSILIQGLTRQVTFFRPPNPGLKKLPLVIDFHGAGGTVWPQAINDPWTAIARRDKFFLLKPQALSDSVNPYTYWNAGFNVSRDDVFFVKAVMDMLVNQERIDSDRIYVTGMSSGGEMAFYFAEQIDSQIAATAPISGTIAKAVLTSYRFIKPMPLCNINGTADTIVNINGGDWYAAWSDILSVWLVANGISTTPFVTLLPDINTTDASTVTKFEYRGTTIASDIDYYKVNNGNHSIPGIESIANQDMNAYEVIWAFFQNHKLSDR